MRKCQRPSFLKWVKNMIRQFTEKDKNSSQTYDKILNLINKQTHKTRSRMSMAFHLPFFKNCQLYFNEARKFFSYLFWSYMFLATFAVIKYWFCSCFLVHYNLLCWCTTTVGSFYFELSNILITKWTLTIKNSRQVSLCIPFEGQWGHNLVMKVILKFLLVSLVLLGFIVDLNHPSNISFKL